MFKKLLTEWLINMPITKNMELSRSQMEALREFARWLDTRSPTLDEAESRIPAVPGCPECGALPTVDHSISCSQG